MLDLATIIADFAAARAPRQRRLTREIPMLWMDAVFLSLLTIAYPIWAARQFPGLLRRIALEGTPARIAGYRETMLALWGFTVVGLALWFATGRGAEALGLGVPGGWGFFTALGLTAIAVVLGTLQQRGIRTDPSARDQVRTSLGDTGLFMPRDAREARWFNAVSLTAGITEEILFRGFLIAFLTPFVGTIGGVILSAVLFGLAHGYAGRDLAIRAGGLGLVFALLYVWTGSLWVPMLLHTFVDINSGQIAALVFRDQEPAEVPS